MSIVTLFLGWTKLPTWLKELIFVGIIVAAAVVALKVHDTHVYDAGIVHQQQIDTEQTQKLLAAANVKSAALLAESNHEHTLYEQALTNDAAARAANPLPPVSLCLSPSDSGGASMPQSTASQSGAANPPSTSGGVLKMPAGNSAVRGGAGPDISGLLDLLAQRADELNLRYTEYYNLRKSP